MSTPSTTEASTAPPRRRFGLPRLADIRIRSKLGLILIVPVLALIGVSSVRLIDSSSNALAAEDSAQIAQFTRAASQLFDALQTERAQASIQLNKKELHLPKDEEAVGNFTKVRDASDKALKKFQAAHANLATDSDDLDQTYDDIARDMTKRGDLYNARARIADGTGGVGDMSPYNAVIAWIQNIYEYANNATDNKTLARDLRAIGLISSADESSEQLRLLMLTVPDGGQLAPEKYRTFVSESAARTASLLEFDRVVAPAQNLPIYESETGLGDENSHDAGAFEETVLNGSPQTSLSVDHRRLIKAYDARHAGSLSYVDKVREQAVKDANSARQAVVTQVLIEITVVLITLVVAVLLALVIARSLALSLRRLREGALEVAHVGLPRAVASMRDSDTLGQRTPAQVVADLGDPLQLDQQDEIGAVAGAFNSVHREAVRIAAEQASLRSSVSTMFVNLARRSQNLVDRLIGHLDRLERGEEDPDRLGDLFQLDHLATRMRRNDENLLVLAGADSTRVERNPAQIGDVLRASQSEVDQYTRVEFGTVLADSEVQAGAVNDIVHLVAELLDNATSFSPPDTSVIAEARQIDDEILVRITDRGVGMSAERLAELNQQLADPGDADVAAPRMMGLVVVARLAQRHRLRVTLQPGGGRGIVAEVVLPKDILTGPTNTRGSRPWPGPGARPPAELPAAHGVSDAPAPPSDAGLDAPRSLFEPLDLPDQEHVEPFAPQPAAAEGTGGFESANPNNTNGSRPGSVSFRPGDGDDTMPRRKLMEVTGEIVAEQPAEYTGPVALPMIRLDAAPLPPETPAPSRSNGSAPASDGPPSWPAVAQGSRTSEPVIAAADAPRAPALDETMELPIFREVESAWFKATTPPPRPAQPDEEAEDISTATPEPADEPAPPAAETAPPAAEPEVAGSGLPQRRKIGKAPEPPIAPEFDPVGDRGDPSVAPDSSWQTPADRGWQVAAEIGNLESDEATEAGLPRRRPMERLIPGSVEVPDTGEPVIPKPRRDPEGVRGLLSAYHRGVQRGRNDGSR